MGWPDGDDSTQSSQMPSTSELKATGLRWMGSLGHKVSGTRYSSIFDDRTVQCVGTIQKFRLLVTYLP